ncbi:unnamed protein product [Pylaiella littoralis]
MTMDAPWSPATIDRWLQIDLNTDSSGVSPRSTGDKMMARERVKGGIDCHSWTIVDASTTVVGGISMLDAARACCVSVVALEVP